MANSIQNLDYIIKDKYEKKIKEIEEKHKEELYIMEEKYKEEFEKYERIVMNDIEEKIEKHQNENLKKLGKIEKNYKNELKIIENKYKKDNDNMRRIYEERINKLEEYIIYLKNYNNKNEKEDINRDTDKNK